jgi:hypothetical protein
LNALERYLERIAGALERIADAIEGDGVESIVTVTPGPFSWDQDAGGFVHITQRAEEATQGRREGRPKGSLSHCGRCGREGRSRRNHRAFCHDCENEPWWDE